MMVVGESTGTEVVYQRPRSVPFAKRLLGDRTAVAGTVGLILIAVAVAAAPWISPADPNDLNTADRLADASLAHPLGTDTLGRDVLSRILHGGRVSLSMALLTTAGITVIGLIVGVAAGLFGGVVDAMAMRLVDIVLAVPLLIVAMVVLGLFGGGSGNLVLTVALLGWPGYARVIRSATLSLREQDFVEAAKAAGVTRTRLMLHHLLPNLAGPATVMSTIDLGRILLTLSALSFLGFGVQPPDPEWGAMLADARNYFYAAPRLLIYPGVAISMLVLAVNLCGDGLRDALDVKVGGR